MTDQEKIAALEAERNALAALVAERSGRLGRILVALDEGKTNVVKHLLLQDHASYPSVERAWLVAEVVAQAIKMHPIIHEGQECEMIFGKPGWCDLAKTIKALAAHDAGMEKK